MPRTTAYNTQSSLSCCVLPCLLAESTIPLLDCELFGPGAIFSFCVGSVGPSVLCGANNHECCYAGFKSAQQATAGGNHAQLEFNVQAHQESISNSLVVSCGIIKCEMIACEMYL